MDHRYRGPQEVKQGATLVLPINFSGSPRPKVTWSHRGIPLTSRPGHVHIETGDGYSTLTIFGIEATETGKYEVAVENVAGATTLDFDVTVKGMLDYFLGSLVRLGSTVSVEDCRYFTHWIRLT